MREYKRFLKIVLGINLTFVLIVALLGYQKEQENKGITEVSGNLNAAAAKKEGATKAERKKVIPVGQTVGIYVNTNGILVIDTGEVMDLSGKVQTPAKNKLMPGDYIVALNGKSVSTKKQLIEDITTCDGEDLIFSLQRKKEEIEVRVKPVETGCDQYKVGIWVRDDLQGLGTITYLDQDAFGALGHSINDTDTGDPLSVSGGTLYKADIFGLEKGKAGNPGVIEGIIPYETENIVGTIEGNGLYGIYGTLTPRFLETFAEEEMVEVAQITDIKEGEAYIQSCLSGKKELYSIEIENIHKNKNGDVELEICVTDDNLLQTSGGIIQGMSGSPVLQNGRIVGAVTHVFVDDPTRGYAIYIEEMMKQ